MSLPNLPAGDKFRREVRTEWGGLNLNESASDGELVEAVNMSSREYPVLSTERFNRKTATLSQIIAPYLVDGELGYIRKIGTNSYKLHDPTTGGGDKDISLTDAQANKVQYGMFGTRMVIWPSKQIYDFSLHTVSDLAVSWTTKFGLNSTAWREGEYDEIWPIEHLGSSVVPMPDFKVGDAVEISGCVYNKSNNKTVILRDIRPMFDSHWLYVDSGSLDFSVMACQEEETLSAGQYLFYRVAGAGYGVPIGKFTLAYALDTYRILYYPDYPDAVFVTGFYNGQYVVGMSVTVVDGDEEDAGEWLLFGTEDLTSYEEPNNLTITRVVPDMDFICVNENRIWGCKGDTIYASKLGDPTNWNVFDGLSTDSWTTETGTDGNFTGCCSFQGYPTFFKEGAVFKVLGDEPKDFTLRKLNIVGVKNGCFRSIVEIHGHLYYLSNIGAVQWNGGDYPQMISAALGTHPGQLIGPAVGGTDGARYFLELTRYGATYTDGAKYASAQRTFVYDTRFGTWHELNIGNGSSRAFCTDGSNSYMISYADPGAVIFSLSEIPTNPLIYNWTVTFADSIRAFKTALTGSESKKGVLRLLIRCKLAGGMKVWIAYDGGEFEEAAEFTAMEKTSKVVPLILRRCDYWQLRLTGTGDAVIYSIAVERYGGEWQQA